MWMNHVEHLQIRYIRRNTNFMFNKWNKHKQIDLIIKFILQRIDVNFGDIWCNHLSLIVMYRILVKPLNGWHDIEIRCASKYRGKKLILYLNRILELLMKREKFIFLFRNGLKKILLFWILDHFWNLFEKMFFAPRKAENTEKFSI